MKISMALRLENATVKHKVEKLESEMKAVKNEVGGMAEMRQQLDLLIANQSAVIEQKADKDGSSTSISTSGDARLSDGSMGFIPIIILNTPLDKRFTEGVGVRNHSIERLNFPFISFLCRRRCSS